MRGRPAEAASLESLTTYRKRRRWHGRCFFEKVVRKRFAPNADEGVADSNVFRVLPRCCRDRVRKNDPRCFERPSRAGTYSGIPRDHRDYSGEAHNRRLDGCDDFANTSEIATTSATSCHYYYHRQVFSTTPAEMADCRFTDTIVRRRDCRRSPASLTLPFRLRQHRR